MILINKKIQKKKEIIFGLMITSGKNILKKIKKQKRLLHWYLQKSFFYLFNFSSKKSGSIP